MYRRVIQPWDTWSRLQTDCARREVQTLIFKSYERWRDRQHRGLFSSLLYHIVLNKYSQEVNTRLAVQSTLPKFDLWHICLWFCINKTEKMIQSIIWIFMVLD